MPSQGNVNKYGTLDDMDWALMENDGVKYQFNYYDTSDTISIEILSHFWRRNDSKIKVKITVFIIGHGTDELEDNKGDYPDTLSLYVMWISIGVK